MNITLNTILIISWSIRFTILSCDLLFILDIIGLTLNTIIFIRPTFRTASCILYFLSSNFADYPTIYFVIPCGFLADGFNNDPTINSVSFCKFREYILTVSAWFIVFASFDRLMSSSCNVHHRQFCHIHIAKRMIMIIIIITFLLFIHIPIFYINHILDDQCYKTWSKFIFNDYFSIYTFYMHNNTTDCIKKFYITLTIDETIDDDVQMVINIFLFIQHQFYTYMLSSKLFRQELKRNLRKLIGIQYKSTNCSSYNYEW